MQNLMFASLLDLAFNSMLYPSIYGLYFKCKKMSHFSQEIFNISKKVSNY